MKDQTRIIIIAAFAYLAGALSFNYFLTSKITVHAGHIHQSSGGVGTAYAKSTF